MASRIGFIGSLAVFTGRLITQGTFDVIALAGGIAALAISGGAGFLADLHAARTEDLVAAGLQAALQDSLSRKSRALIHTRAAGALISGLQRHPTALSSLVISHSGAKFMLAIGPLLAALAIAFVSWEAALALFLAVPTMVVFFVILGSAIQAKAEAQERAFGRVASQFSDRVRTLPSILANHALLHEHGKIERRMALYADSTMGVLKVAFLNAGIIDFFSSIAIALLAVFLGLGHLGLAQIRGFSGLELWQSLFILIAAAEFFTPLRRYAEQYHMKAEGQAAAKELDWYFDESDNSEKKPFPIDKDFDTAKLPPTGLIVFSGPSGSGKSTLLRMLAGIETPALGVEPLHHVIAEGCDWISTDIYVPAGTLGEAIGWNRSGHVGSSELREAAERVGLLNERLLPGGLDARIANGGENLSGGQRMRIGIARVLFSSRTVFADEPTAKLDPRTAKLVRGALIEAAKRRLVIVATHDRLLMQAAGMHHILQLQAHQAVAA